MGKDKLKNNIAQNHAGEKTKNETKDFIDLFDSTG